ncbi:MAG: hypothetical protein VKK04_10090 [Synechococcales bacterium]|nr:hypothetical protein [Synechococcales bacterium]
MTHMKWSRVWGSGAIALSLVLAWGTGAIADVILQEQGSLDPGDAVIPSDGSLYDEYAFEGQVGDYITIRLESTDFDTYLILVGPDGTVVDRNDNLTTDTRNSGLALILPENGTYLAIANSYDGTGRGQYTLTVTAGDSPYPTPEPDPATPSESEELPST